MVVLLGNQLTIPSKSSEKDIFTTMTLKLDTLQETEPVAQDLAATPCDEDITSHQSPSKTNERIKMRLHKELVELLDEELQRRDLLIKSYKYKNGCCNPSILRDTKGMLSLYEASFLVMDGEDELDEVKEFDLIRSNFSANSMLSQHLTMALKLPLHYRIPKLQAIMFMEGAHNMKELNMDPIVLELAQILYNINEKKPSGENEDEKNFQDKYIMAYYVVLAKRQESQEAGMLAIEDVVQLHPSDIMIQGHIPDYPTEVFIV